MSSSKSVSGYKIKQTEFSGPIGLLLDLIRKKKVEIYQIKISEIIKGFIIYISKNKDVLIDEISSFLYVAVLLMEYKSRNLLPSSKIEDEEEVVDKDLLLTREIEYIAFKNISIYFDSL